MSRTTRKHPHWFWWSYQPGDPKFGRDKKPGKPPGWFKRMRRRLARRGKQSRRLEYEKHSDLWNWW